MSKMECTFDFNELTDELRLQYCEKCLAQKHPEIAFDIYLAETELCDCCKKLNDVVNPAFSQFVKEKGIDSIEWLFSNKDRVYRNPVHILDREQLNK